MKLGQGETKLAEYGSLILTNRRLVVTCRNAEESYPLSKISKVRTEFSPVWSALITGVIVVILGGLMAFGQLGSVLEIGAILAMGAVLIYFGWRGKIRPLIRMQGGEDKDFEVYGKDQKFIEFADALKQQLP